MSVCWVDCETYHPRLDVTDVGAEKYARECEIILAGWAIDDGPVNIWEVGEDPTPVQRALHDSRLIAAHNSFFERNVFYRNGWCNRPLKHWHCTMAQAFSHGLPGQLSALCRFLGLDEDKQKIKDGSRLINLFSRPQRGGLRADKETHPHDWELFRMYQEMDVVSMRECARLMLQANLGADFRA